MPYPVILAASTEASQMLMLPLVQAISIALDDIVTSGIAMFLHKTLIDSLSGMMLLAPMFLVFVQPFLDDGFEGIQLG